ncbi:MAG: alpha-L-fucosidase [Candidatus Synoicihabitans palmerolidicus]|nr:alpha-L-fucosidase [Candidatus Synoicihabitans palmerolidicus]
MVPKTGDTWCQYVITAQVGLVWLCGAAELCAHGQMPRSYTSDWSSLEQHQAVPEWVLNSKFGIYTHWGVYSVPTYNNEHYLQHMHRDGDYAKLGTHRRHVAVYGPLEEFDYHLIPMFKGEHFDAEAWADLFVKAGARFAGSVAEHHDGFAMWDSALPPFHAAAMGPKRDVVGELEQAIRRRGLKFFASLHHELNYTNVQMKAEWAGAGPKYAKLYGSTMDKGEWRRMWRDKCIEVVEKYHPDLIYHDVWLERVDQAYHREYLARYFNDAALLGQKVTVSYKGEDLPYGVGILDHENDNPGSIEDDPWLCDFSIGTGYSYSWDYTEGMTLRSATEVVTKLIEVVAKNGTMLLNLSPKSDGTIPDAQRQIALKVGQWLWSLGEGIYDTRPYATEGEEFADTGPVYYTRQDLEVYAILLNWPGDDTEFTLREVTPTRLGGDRAKVTLLGLQRLRSCDAEFSDDGLVVHVPRGTRQPSEIAHVFRIEME